MVDERRIRTLLLDQNFVPGIDAFYRSHIHRFQGAGFAVEGFCVTMDPPAPRMGPLSEMSPVIAMCESC